MVIVAMIAASAVLAAQPASATPAPPTNGAAAPQGAGAPAKKNAFENDDKIVCITTEVTGSLFPKKQCATRAQWEALKQDSQDLHTDMTTRHQGASALGGQ
jgi:hypothetical protein